MIKEDTNAHSHFAPSKRGIWEHCASTLKYGQYQRVTSYMKMGTAGHMLLETCLRLSDDPERYIGDFIFEDIQVTDDMANAVGHAIDFVKQYQSKNPSAKLYIEKRVDPFALIKCAPGLASGTLDLCFDNPARDELVMIDYKHGMINVGVLSPQLLQYVIGYVSQHATRRYKRYVLVIIQPREFSELGPVRFVKLTYDDIMTDAAKLGARIKEILRKPDQLAAGPWCRFCPAGARCNERAKYALGQAQIEFRDRTMKVKDVNEVTPKQLGELLKAWHEVIEPWGKALYSTALEQMLAGDSIPGQKLVLSKAIRRFGNTNQTARLLYTQFQFAKDQIAPRKLLSVAGIEKLFRARMKRGRKADPLPPVIKDLILPSNPAIRIARANDPRKEYKRGSEFKERE